MAIVAGQTFTDPTSANTSIDSILTQEANRIGSDIHRRTVHVSPWMDLIKQTAFPDGMGYKLGTMIYDRALPVTTVNGNTLAVSSANSWQEVGVNAADSTVVDTSSRDQLIAGARDQFIGAGNDNLNGKSFISFARQLKQYSLKRATVESPKINVEDLRFAAYRTEQLRAVMDALTESTRFTWEERYRDEYDRICGNVVNCKTTGTVITSTGKENLATGGPAGVTVGIYAFGADSTALPTANASNKIFDSIYFRLVRSGAGTNAYGRENARPVFGLVCSSELSYALQTEAGFRDDVRYNQSKVSELIAPLGVEKAFRGFYHLIDDLAPRFIAATANNGTLTRVYPYTIAGTDGASGNTGAVIVNTAYDIADFEAAYVLHQDVMESQIPEPITGSNGLTFDPVNYRGKFAWKNIPSVDKNPDGTIGFFRGILASASKPIKTDFGFAVIFKRNSLTPAA
jgi:hypothetical protein